MAKDIRPGDGQDVREKLAQELIAQGRRLTESELDLVLAAAIRQAIQDRVNKEPTAAELPALTEVEKQKVDRIVGGFLEKLLRRDARQHRSGGQGKG